MFTNQPTFTGAITLSNSKTVAIIRDIALVFSFAIITAFCAKIKVETGAVPVTMQTFAVLLSGALLGSKKGALSQITYLFGGLMGIPWFSRGGGIVYVLSPTFGYMTGFIAAAFMVGWLCEKGWDRKIKTVCLAMFIGSIFIYVFGLLWLIRFTGFGKVLAIGLYPFILGDILKIILAGLLLPLGRKIIKRKA